MKAILVKTKRALLLLAVVAIVAPVAGCGQPQGKLVAEWSCTEGELLCHESAGIDGFTLGFYRDGNGDIAGGLTTPEGEIFGVLQVFDDSYLTLTLPILSSEKGHYTVTKNSLVIVWGSDGDQATDRFQRK
jgi:hypothetical protein